MLKTTDPHGMFMKIQIEKYHEQILEAYSHPWYLKQHKHNAMCAEINLKQWKKMYAEYMANKRRQGLN